MYVYIQMEGFDILNNTPVLASSVIVMVLNDVQLHIFHQCSCLKTMTQQ